MQVYKITNIINDKIYIGLTVTSIGARIASYKSATKSPKLNKHRIIQAMKKYGFNNFKFEILYTTESHEDLKNKEIEFISLLKSTDPTIGYNVSPGGFSHSEEMRRKKSEALKNTTLTENHKHKISQGLMGHTVSDKVRETSKINGRKIGGWNRGTKGVMKANSGSFGNGRSAPNKGRIKTIINGKIRYIKAEEYVV